MILAEPFRALRLCSGSNPHFAPERIARFNVQNSGGSGIFHSVARMMLIIAFIEDDNIIQIILKHLGHLGLWMTRNHDPPREKAIETTELIYDGQYAQVPLDVHWVQ